MEKMGFRLQIQVFFALITSLDFLIVISAITHSSDIEALKEMKRGIDPASITPGSCISSWDFSYDPCDATFSDHFTCGLRCDAAVDGFNRVTEIALDRPGYAGSIVLSSLPYLETLDLADNQFSGEIPPAVGNLTRLRRLSLSNNFVSGEIPSSLGSLSSLEEVYLDNNVIQGQIPASLAGLQSLKRLELQRNWLSGEFPHLGTLQNLYFVNAGDNWISGRVPSSLPSSLVELSMRNNSLKGRIPEGLKRLTFLQVLDLSYNKLSGKVAGFLFEHPSLEQLTLSHNGFSAVQTPASNGLKSELIAVDMGYNKIQGMLPFFIAMMPRLSAVSFEKNQLTGLIPSPYALRTVIPLPGTAPFERLLLSGNYLFGPIPSPLMAMKSGSAMVSLVDNCLMRCPEEFFFCQGGSQKSSMACRNFSPVIPLH